MQKRKKRKINRRKKVWRHHYSYSHCFHSLSLSHYLLCVVGKFNSPMTKVRMVMIALLLIVINYLVLQGQL